MQDQAAISTQQKFAKVAGLSYLVTTAIIVYTYFGISNHLIVAGIVAQTAGNILQHQSLFRLTIVLYLVYCAGLIVLVSALYIILKSVNGGLALVATFLRFVFALVWIPVVLNLFMALRFIVGNDSLKVFELNRLQALAGSFLSSSDAYYVGLFFWSTASSICAYLWFKSRYVPSVLSLIGIISSVWCIACTLAYIIYPDFSRTVNLWWFDSPMVVFEIALSFLLLLRGLRLPGNKGKARNS